MNVIKYTSPWKDWNATTVFDGADIILTENGREASVGQFTLKGFSFGTLDTGDYIAFMGSPHVWFVSEAEYKEDNDETTYSIIDAFCFILKNRVLGYDLFTNQRLINDRVENVLDAVKGVYPYFTGWNVSTLINGDYDVLEDPRTTLAETSRAGDNALDIIYGLIEATDACLWIQTSVKNATELNAVLVWRNASPSDALPAPGNTTITRTANMYEERVCIVEGRTLDYSINTTDPSADVDTKGTGPAISNFLGITEGINVTPEIRPLITVTGTDRWSRDNLLVSPSTISNMLQFNAALPAPAIAVYNYRMWISCNCGIFDKGAAGALNSIVIPYAAPEIGKILKRNTINYNGFDCYIGWMAAELLLEDQQHNLAVTQMVNVIDAETMPAEIIYNNGLPFYALSDFNNKTFGNTRKTGCAAVFITDPKDAYRVWVPLSGSADTSLEREFRVLDKNNRDDRLLMSSPLLYPLDLWRLPYASLKSVEGSIKKGVVSTSTTIDVSNQDININDMGFDNETYMKNNIYTGSLLKTMNGDLLRVTAVTQSYNDDGTVKYDLETTTYKPQE